MNVLAVNNGTIHFSELLELLKKHQVTSVDKDNVAEDACKEYDLVVLSGGNHSPVVSHPDFYKKELQMIRSCKKPVIGICMGFELIAYAFGAELAELPGEEEGNLQIKVTKKDKIFGNIDSFDVYEHHRWVVRSLKAPLVALATSKDGIEVVKHKFLPIYGFQFHPEVLEQGNSGHEVFQNLLGLIEKWVVEAKSDY